MTTTNSELNALLGLLTLGVARRRAGGEEAYSRSEPEVIAGRRLFAGLSCGELAIDKVPPWAAGELLSMLNPMLDCADIEGASLANLRVLTELADMAISDGKPRGSTILAIAIIFQSLAEQAVQACDWTKAKLTATRAVAATAPTAGATGCWDELLDNIVIESLGKEGACTPDERARIERQDLDSALGLMVSRRGNSRYEHVVNVIGWYSKRRQSFGDFAEEMCALMETQRELLRFGRCDAASKLTARLRNLQVVFHYNEQKLEAELLSNYLQRLPTRMGHCQEHSDRTEDASHMTSLCELVERKYVHKRPATSQAEVDRWTADPITAWDERYSFTDLDTEDLPAVVAALETLECWADNFFSDAAKQLEATRAPDAKACRDAVLMWFTSLRKTIISDSMSFGPSSMQRSVCDAAHGVIGNVQWVETLALMPRFVPAVLQERVKQSAHDAATIFYLEMLGKEADKMHEPIGFDDIMEWPLYKLDAFWRSTRPAG